MYEYCVMYKGIPDEPHRVPPKYDDYEENIDPLAWCQEWVNEFYEDVPNAHPDMFYVARREVPDWTKYE